MSVVVSIVIPSWNGKALLTECLNSLERQTFKDYEVIVVDDGSDDGTSEMLEKDFTHVRVERFTENRGFCAAVNKGIELVGTDLILLLNNDMTFAEDFLEKLVDAAMSSSASMFTPLILWQDEPVVIYAAGDRQCANGRPESIGFRCKREGFEFSKTVFGVTAGAALYRREIFDKIGLLDERYNIYFSDSDLNFRARLMGFEAECVPESVIYHVGSASLMGKPLKRTIQCYTNHALLIMKNMPMRLVLKHAPAILSERMHQLWRVFSAARCECGIEGAFVIVLKTWFSVLCLLPYALHERRRIQRERTIEISELDALLD